MANGPLTNALQNYLMGRQARQQQIDRQRQIQSREMLGQMLQTGQAPEGFAQLNPEAYMMGSQEIARQRAAESQSSQNALIQQLRQEYAQTQDPTVLRQLVAIDPEASGKIQEQMGVIDDQTRQEAINEATAFAQIVRQSPDRAMDYFNENLADKPAFQSLADELAAGDYEDVLNGIGVGITALGGQEAYDQFIGADTKPDIGTYNPRDYTVESFAEFERTGDSSVLERYEPSKTTEIGGVPHVFNPASGNWQPVRITRDGQDQEVTTEDVAKSAAEIAAEKEAAVQKARSQVEIEQGRDKAVERAREQMTTLDNTITEIDKAIEQADDFSATGFMGNLTRSLAGTPAYDLKQRVLTIKANIGFDRLQRMRELSPTGGALGNVANQELDALQATIASLDTAQSKEQLIENLRKIKRHYGRWREAVNKHYEGLKASGETPQGSGVTESEADDSNIVVRNHPTYGNITEADISATMEANGLTRQEVLDIMQQGGPK